MFKLCPDKPASAQIFFRSLHIPAFLQTKKSIQMNSEKSDSKMSEDIRIASSAGNQHLSSLIWVIGRVEYV